VLPNQAVSRPVKPVPCTVTTVPSGPLNGVKLMMYGWGTVAELLVLGFAAVAAVLAVLAVVLLVLDFVIVKEFGENDECTGLRTASWPVTASCGMVTSTLVSLSTWTAPSRAVPIHAVVSPVKPEPVTVTTVPTAPDVGANVWM
jgi:hypothetical protein